MGKLASESRLNTELLEPVVGTIASAEDGPAALLQ